ncbi:MAG: non-canonical purine NTP pyrophosphatase [Rhizomicrobium sp.]
MTLSRGDTLVVASHNPGKVREIVELLAPYRLHVLGAGDLEIEEPEETEATFAGNAALKALWVANRCGHIALADDSGPERRRAGRGAGRLFRALGGTAQGFRGGDGACRTRAQGSRRDRYGPRNSCPRWRSPCRTKRRASSKARCTAIFSFRPRGTNGFGYDPIFVAQGMRQTFGEMAPAAKLADEPSQPRLREAHRERRLRVMSGFGIYVHWPFCAAKCPYCDFNSMSASRSTRAAGSMPSCASWNGRPRARVRTGPSSRPCSSAAARRR